MLFVTHFPIPVIYLHSLLVVNTYAVRDGCSEYCVRSILHVLDAKQHVPNVQRDTNF